MPIELPVRYYRTVVDPERESRVANFGYGFDELPLPAGETALVLVDCWNDHRIDGLVERMEPLIEETIAPVLDALRDTAVTVAHCPSPDVARNYPGMRPDLEPADRSESGDESGIEWPPPGFREATDHWRTVAGEADVDEEYAAYARPAEPGYARPWDAVHPALDPEPRDDEFVVATGDELHRLLARRGVLHLLYVGFHTNRCVRNRDYGIVAMDRRGYDPILLRDCTQAIESHDTVDSQLHRKIAIREMESTDCYTATSDDLLDALS